MLEKIKNSKSYNIITNCEFLDDDLFSKKLVEYYKRIVDTSSDSVNLDKIKKYDRVMRKYIEDYTFSKKLKNSVDVSTILKSKVDLSEVVLEYAVDFLSKYDEKIEEPIVNTRWIWGIMDKLKIVFMGTPEFGLPSLEKLNEIYDIVLVVCQPDKPSNRGIVKYSKIKEFAINNNILVYQPSNVKNEYKPILDMKPDMIITCAYGQIIPKEILDYPKYGCINIHASLLPKLRGGAPIHRAIIEGHKESGITIMKMSLKMDAGDIITQESVWIKDDDTVGILHDKLSLLASDLIIKTIPLIVNNTIVFRKQNENEVTYGFVITKEDEHINFNNTTRDVINRIRGLNPFPGAFAILDGKIVKLWLARYGKSDNSNAIFGEIINIYDDGIGIKTIDGEVIITELQLEGRKRMDASSFLRGIANKRDLIGKVFE